MKKTIKTNTVTDEQGRTRFHGAFTGGFSAGYFNTVGSSEGFKPAQFVSSRSRRADVSVRSVANYMDEGDGLLGGKLSTNSGLDSFAVPASGAVRPSDEAGSLGAALGVEIVQQQSDTIGKKLLATMGWRVGHGIGPRVTKKRINYFASDRQIHADVEVHPGADLSKLPSALRNSKVTFAPDDEAQRIAFPPPKLDVYGLGFDARKSGSLAASLHGDARGDEAYEEEEDGARYHMGAVLAGGAKSTLGGSERSRAGNNKRGSPAYGLSKPEAKRLKYTSGFAYDDAEDDVYSGSSAPLRLMNGGAERPSAGSSGVLVPFGYSTEVVDPEELEGRQQVQHKFAEKSRETLHSIQDSVSNWLGGADNSVASAGNLAETVRATMRCPSDNRPPLPGFHVARTPRVTPPHYTPPVVPSDFVPYHSFAKPDAVTEARSAKNRNRRQDPYQAAKQRSAAMSEVPAATAPVPVVAATAGSAAEGSAPKAGSIFDLIKPEARAKLQSVLDSVNPQHTVRIAEKPPAPPLPPIPCHIVLFSALLCSVRIHIQRSCRLHYENLTSIME
jgi:hypothetical protein